MSVVGYFGPRSGDLLVKAADLSKGVGEVENGRLPVEESQTPMCLREERYETVGDYDAVLRSHCRLDQEG